MKRKNETLLYAYFIQSAKECISNWLYIHSSYYPGERRKILIMLYQHFAASPVDRCQTLIYGAPRGALRGSKMCSRNSNSADSSKGCFSTSVTVATGFINELLFICSLYLQLIRACDAIFCQQTCSVGEFSG